MSQPVFPARNNNERQIGVGNRRSRRRRCIRDEHIERRQPQLAPTRISNHGLWNPDSDNSSPRAGTVMAMPVKQNRPAAGPQVGDSERTRQHRRQHIGGATHPLWSASALSGPSAAPHVHRHKNEGNSIKRFHEFDARRQNLEAPPVRCGRAGVRRPDHAPVSAIRPAWPVARGCRRGCRRSRGTIRCAGVIGGPVDLVTHLAN